MSTLKYIIRAKNEGQTKIVEVEISATFDDVKQKIQGLFKGKTITPLVCASTKATISNEEEFKAALEASKSEKSFVIEAGSQEVPKKEEPKKAAAAAAAPATSSKPSTPRKEEPKKAAAAAAAPATSSKPSTPRKEEPKKAAAAPAPAAGANKCVKCSAKLPDGAKFCNKCGAPQNAAPAAAPAAASAPKEEPKKAENCCAACGKPLCGSSISLGSGENYHPECFVCGECGKGIRGQYMKIDGKFICGACYEAKHQEACAGCGKPINGQYVGVGDKNYHPECFVCSKCNKQINGRFRYGRDGGLLCPSCN